MPLTASDRYAKLARAAYYRAIGGWARDREWPTLNPDERAAWASVAWVVLNAAPGDDSRDAELVSYVDTAHAAARAKP
jgi:hypothetical protein